MERERVSFICLRVSDPYRAFFEIFRGNFLLQTRIVAVGIRPIPRRRRLPRRRDIREDKVTREWSTEGCIKGIPFEKEVNGGDGD